ACVLTGAAPAACARGLSPAPGGGAAEAVGPPTLIHLVANDVPYWWSETYPAELEPEMSVFAAAATSAAEELAGWLNVNGLPPTRTCSACSWPPARRLAGSFGLNRDTKLFGCLVRWFAPLPFAPPTSSTRYRLPLVSFCTPSKPARPITFERSCSVDGQSVADS